LPSVEYAQFRGGFEPFLSAPMFLKKVTR